MSDKNKQLSYWDKRSIAIEEKINKQSNKAIKDMELAYKSAIMKLQREIEIWYSKIGENNRITYQDALKLLKDDELEEFKWTVEQYIKNGKNQYSKEMIKQLKNASARVHIKKLDALKLIVDTELDGLSTYKQSFLDKLLNKTTDYTFSETIKQMTGKIQHMDRYKIRELLKRPWAPDRVTFSKRIWKNKKLLSQKLHRHLSESIITGQHVKDAVLKISKEMRVDLNRTRALVYTESSALSAQSKLEAYKELGVTKYKIVAVLDYKTSPTCTMMNEKVFDISEYRIGETAPPFHVNCRTTTSPVLDDWDEEDAERDNEELERDSDEEPNKNVDDDLQNVEDDSIIEMTDVYDVNYIPQPTGNNLIPSDDVELFDVEQGKKNLNEYMIEKGDISSHIKDYTFEDFNGTSSYNYIREHLSGTYLTNDPKIEELISILDDVTKSIPSSQTFYTYRGLKDMTILDRFKNLKKGSQLILDPSFMSTSVDMNRTLDFIGDFEYSNEPVGIILRILVKKGQKVGAYISEHSSMEREMEFLMARNLNLKFKQYKKRKFKMGDYEFESYIVDLEVME